MPSSARPHGVTALSIFFAAGSLIAFTSMVSLLAPGSFLEPMWRLNPRARTAFASMGFWAPVLMGFVSAACASAASGLWRGRRWGHHFATGILVVNLVGDTLNVVLGTEPRAIIGIPINALLLVYLFRSSVRRWFV